MAGFPWRLFPVSGVNPVTGRLTRCRRQRSVVGASWQSNLRRIVGLRALALVLTLFGGPPSVEAQPAGKVYRIGLLLSAGGDPTRFPLVEGFRQGLREQGYVEGRNVVIELRAAEGRAERLPQLAAELVSLKPDVLVAAATPGALAARNATRTIPIVMVAVGDPVGSGLVYSLAQPGGNVTGVSLLNVEFSGKRLQLLKEAVPHVSRVAFLWNPLNPLNAAILKETEAAAATLRMQLEPVAARAPEDLRSALGAATGKRVEALVVAPDSMLLLNRKHVIDFAAANRLPAMYNFRDDTESGGLMSYGADLYDTYRRGAIFVDKILRGAKPADLPVEQPSRLHLIINLRTAKTLGLTIPPAVLARADQVIE
jgi:putative tryptophan/tyrosine transport system substrate-binding protein